MVPESVDLARDLFTSVAGCIQREATSAGSLILSHPWSLRRLDMAKPLPGLTPPDGLASAKAPAKPACEPAISREQHVIKNSSIQ